MSTETIATAEQKTQQNATETNTPATTAIPTSTEEQSKPKLEGDALKDALKKQIEYYFSKENLMTDRYLVSQMNSETYVPIKTIANFKMIKNLTTDMDLIVSVMKTSSVVHVDDANTMVKPNFKPHRNVVILREISRDTPVEEVKNIFASEDFGKVTDVKSEVGDLWYITFEKDEDAVSAVDKLRERKFQNNPIKARLKTESTFRSISLAATTIPAPTTETAVGYTPYGVYFPPNYQPQQGQTQQQGQPQQGGRRGGNYGGNRRNQRRGNNAASSGNAAEGSATGNSSGRSKNYKGRNSAESGKNATEGGSRKRRGSESKRTAPPLGPANFPPLPTAVDKVSGYTEPFQQWTRQEFLDIANQIKENVQKPEGINNETSVLLATPNTELELTKPVKKTETKKSQAETAWKPTATGGKQPAAQPVKSQGGATANKPTTAATTTTAAAKQPNAEKQQAAKQNTTTTASPSSSPQENKVKSPQQSQQKAAAQTSVAEKTQ